MDNNSSLKNFVERIYDVVINDEFIPDIIFEELPNLLKDSCAVFKERHERDVYLTGALTALRSPKMLLKSDWKARFGLAKHSVVGAVRQMHFSTPTTSVFHSKTCSWPELKLGIETPGMGSGLPKRSYSLGERPGLA